MQQINIKKYAVTSFLEVQENTQTGFKSLFTTQNLEPNIILSTFLGDKILAQPNRYTLQISQDEHIELLPEYLRYTNHSCAPNVFLIQM